MCRRGGFTNRRTTTNSRLIVELKLVKYIVWVHKLVLTFKYDASSLLLYPQKQKFIVVVYMYLCGPLSASRDQIAGWRADISLLVVSLLYGDMHGAKTDRSSRSGNGRWRPYTIGGRRLPSKFSILKLSYSYMHGYSRLKRKDLIFRRTNCQNWTMGYHSTSSMPSSMKLSAIHRSVVTCLALLVVWPKGKSDLGRRFLGCQYELY